MKRSEFFKSIFAAGAVSLIPTAVIAATPEEKKYKFDEIFHIHEGNPNLIYPRIESDIYKEIRKVVEDRLVDSFSYYLPERSVLLPIKEEYTISDFIPFMLVLKKNECSLFVEYQHGSFFCFIKDTKNGKVTEESMHLKLFATNLNDIPSQYAPHVLNNYSD